MEHLPLAVAVGTVALDRGTMSRYVEHAGNTLGATIVGAMWADAIAHAQVISTDATGALIQPTQVAGNDRAQACKKGHLSRRLSTATRSCSRTSSTTAARPRSGCSASSVVSCKPTRAMSTTYSIVARRMDALTRSPPTAFADEPRPRCRRGEDLADALSIASEGANRHVPVLGRQDHLLHRGHLIARELAGACARARRTVSEFACLFGSPPGVLAPRFEPGDVQDGGQGKEGFSAGDGAKDAGFGLSFWETNSIEGEAGGTKQGEQEAQRRRGRARVSPNARWNRARSACCRTSPSSRRREVHGGAKWKR